MSSIDNIPHFAGAGPKMVTELQDYAIILLNVNGDVINWNVGAERIKGYKTDEIIGKSFRQFYMPADQRNKLPEKLIEKAKQHGNVTHEGWRMRKDGSRFWGSTVITALHDSHGAIVNFTEITRDLTAKRDTDYELKTAAETLAKRNEALRKSEEQYHKMVSEVRDYAIILLSPDGDIMSWNLGAERIKGYKAEEIIGKNFRIFYQLQDRIDGRPDRLRQQAIDNGSAVDEGWRVRKDGSRFWGSITITALHADDGSIIGFSKVTRDLTEKKNLIDDLQQTSSELQQRNDELQKSEERYHQMIAEVQDYAIILLDENGNILNWNAGAEKIKGYKATEIIGTNFRIFYTDKDKAEGLPQKLINQAITTGKATHEGWRVRKDGSKFWGSITITALHDLNGNILGFSKVTRDLTERKLADDKMREYIIMLERQNLELEQFAYIASHDLQEPLRKIQTFADIIQHNLHDKKMMERYFEKIKISTARMRALINSLLDYSRLGKEKGNKIYTDLNMVLETVLFDFELLIQEKHATIINDPLPSIEVYPDQITQLFANLIGNALKFSDKKPLIQIKSQLVAKQQLQSPPEHLTKNEYIELSFQDNGIGFDSEHEELIFSIFQRLHGRSQYEGTGIGLSICRKIVESHSGFIRAKGTPGKGACFYVYLPVK
ncbi:PAS domain S-box protein [Chitinophaga agrisoli]|uniref:histidine kinase n=1 Tax=Chitinophaga agrisoli TaxID=2607653 RepID=A0A5B2VWX0_9BACT|nr:PAS domain-containing sensor histidine kinase [Chitinophaga agrisoli]KAA2242696.1 PAS domain S-box protein [Chitinophaga agrisoli]